MKMFGKNEDRVIDNLLRASMKGRGGPNPACREFDPDLANAYIERSLSAGERAGYERHLSECHACRSGVVALSRIVEAEAAPAVAALSVREASPFAMLKGLFTPSAMPRVAAAALAVVVLAVSIPLLFSREERVEHGPPSDVAAEQKAKAADDQPASPGSRQPNSSDVLNSGTGQAAQADGARARAVSREQEQPASPVGETAMAKQQPAEPEVVQSGAGPARAEPPQTEKLEAKSAAASSDQARKVESDTQQVAKDRATPPPSPPAPAAEAPAPLGQINPEDARRLRQQEKDAVSVTIKPGNVGGVPGVEKEERSTIRPTDAVAPPSSAGSGERSRGLAEPSPRSRRDGDNTGGAAFATRGSPTRKVGGKKFWLSKDTWTDKDYNPNKELPVVTIERDSDIYKELLTKRSGLKLYLMGFGEGERAIFVYKGTVYRLVPQNSR